jgi:hypothetical protein
MKISARIGQATLYLFIISSGIQVGAALYEIFVVTPLWSGSTPESVTGWNPVAQYAINPGQFWGKATPFYAICALLAVITAWLLPKPQRNLMLFAGIVALIVVLFTAIFFVPILMKTIATRGAGLSGEEITRMVNQWVNWNWLRLAAVCAAWLVAIRALSSADRITVA